MWRIFIELIKLIHRLLAHMTTPESCNSTILFLKSEDFFSLQRKKPNLSVTFLWMLLNKRHLLAFRWAFLVSRRRLESCHFDWQSVCGIMFNPCFSGACSELISPPRDGGLRWLPGQRRYGLSHFHFLRMKEKVAPKSFTNTAEGARVLRGESTRYWSTFIFY